MNEMICIRDTGNVCEVESLTRKDLYIVSPKTSLSVVEVFKLLPMRRRFLIGVKSDHIYVCESKDEAKALANRIEEEWR